jgi:SAM-dependent methyltransferase
MVAQKCPKHLGAMPACGGDSQNTQSLNLLLQYNFRMSIDRRNRIAFEDVADLYNEVRPGYPEQLVEDVIALSQLPPGGHILEVGAGPGNATVLFAQRMYRILGIELGERLAAYARENCRLFPHVKILNTAFEDWQVEAGAVDLAISADAFHWIPPEIGYPRLAQALKPRGSAALFWNVPVDPQTEWSQAIAEVYHEVAPSMENPEQGQSLEWLEEVITQNFAQCGQFGEVTEKKYPANMELTTEAYLKLLRTFSGHRGLDEKTRGALFWGIRSVLEAFGGRVKRPHVVLLFHAVK